MSRGKLATELAARRAIAHNEDAAFGQLLRAVIVCARKLSHGAIQLVSEEWHERLLKCSGGDDYACRAEPVSLCGRREKPIIATRERNQCIIQLDRHPHHPRVVSEVISDLVLGRITNRIASQGQTGKRGVFTRGKEHERIVSFTPGVAEPAAAIEQGEGNAPLFQEISNCESRLSCSEDKDVECLGEIHSIRHTISRRASADVLSPSIKDFDCERCSICMKISKGLAALAAFALLGSAASAQTPSRQTPIPCALFSAAALEGNLLRNKSFPPGAASRCAGLFFLGRHDRVVTWEVAERYFNALEAPRGKQLIWFEDSGHWPQFEESQKYRDTLVRRLLAETLGGQNP